MPSENYHYNPGDEWAQDYKKDPYRLMKYRPQIRNAAPLAYYGAGKAHAAMTPHHQKEAQRKLKNLQKSAPKLAQNLAKGKPSALVGLAGNMLRKIDWSKDWMFIPFLASCALLKDLLDIVFGVASTAASGIPLLGQATIAVGIIVTFTGEVFLLILTVVVLVLTGSSLKNRGMAKYFIGLSVAFISEALPGIGWLPLATIEVFILFAFVLFDRAFEEPAEKSENKNVPAYAAADN